MTAQSDSLATNKKLESCGQQQYYYENPRQYLSFEQKRKVIMPRSIFRWLNINPSAFYYLIAACLYGFAGSIIWVVFNLYLLETGLNEEQIGAVSSLATLSGSLVSLIFSFYVPMFGFYNIMISAVSASALALGICISTSHFHLIAAVYVFHGIGSGIVNIIRAPLTMEITSPRIRQSFFSIQAGILTLVAFFAHQFSGWLPKLMVHYGVASRDAYRTVIATAMIMFILSGWFFTRIRLKRLKMREKVPSNFLKTVAEFKNRMLLLKFMLPTIAIGFGAGVVPMMNVYFKQKHGYNVFTISMIFAFSQLMLAGLTMLNPIITRKFRPVTFVMLTRLLSLPFILIFVWTDNLYILSLAFMARESLMNMNSPVADYFYMSCFHKKYRPVLCAIRDFSWNIAWSASIYSVGVMQHRGYYDFPLYGTMMCYFASVVFMGIFFFRREEKLMTETEDFSQRIM